MNRSAQSGFVLPLTVAAVLILAMTVAPVFDGINVAVTRAQRGRDRLNGALAQEAATTAALLAIATQGGDALPEVTLDGRAYRTGAALLALQDLRGLASLDAISGPTLRRLLIGLGVDEDRTSALVDAYFDAIDADDLSRAGGGERDAYLAAGLPPPRNEALATPFEAVEILGWREEESLWRDQAWARSTTARGPGGFNPDVAPRGALTSLDGVSGDLADAIRAERGGGTIALLPPSARNDARTMVLQPSGALRATVASGASARWTEFRVTAIDPMGPWRIDWSVPVPVSSAGLPRTHEDLPIFPPLRSDAPRP